MNKLLLVALLVTFGFITTYGQGIRVSGKVTSSKDGTELPGVNVRIKNTNKGTIADAFGNYELLANKPSDTLQFSFIGYITIEQIIGNRSTINIQLEQETTQLGEVVVTGFQEVERKLFTGSAASVKMEDIKTPGMTDASRMLEGRVAGVTVDNVSGTFGTAPKIRIRGNTTINGDTKPLMVIDGVILEDLNNVSADDIITGNANTLTASSIAGINPDDIESFQVLKDASATALYGTRAKNGVIVITTKRGRSGQTRVNYTGNFSFNLRPSYSQYDILNSVDEMSIYREMYDKGLVDITTSVKAQNYGSLGKMFTLISEHQIPWGPNGSLNEEFLHQYESANTDWFDVLFKDYSLQQQHSVSLTSGTEKHTSYYSISYLHDNGQTIADNVKRYAGTAKNSFQFSKRFSLDLKLTANYRDQKVPGTQNRDFDPITGRYRRDFDINPLSYALNTARTIRPYDSEGNLEYFRRNYAPFNILRELELNYININVADVSTQADVNVDILDNLTFRSTLQGRYATTKREHVIHENSNQAEAYRADETQYIQDANPLLFKDPNDPGALPKVVLPEGGFNNINQDELTNFYIRNSINWSHTINTVHSINILAGQEIKFTNRESVRADGIGVVYENGGIVNMDPLMIQFLNQQGIRTYALSVDRERFAGVFINGGYAYNEKYIFNGTVRYDGSNRLGKSRNSRYLPTWNVSGAWNVDKEDFIDLQWLDFLKLRATYGLSANLGPNTSALLNLRSAVTLRPTDIETYLYIQDLENADLTWEKLKEFNAGFDFGIFNNRITGTGDFYHRNCFDLIGLLQTSGVGGNAYKWGNYADMVTNGFEFSINTLNLKLNDFSWSTNFNIGYSRDRITRLDFNPRIGDAIVQGGAAVLGGPRRGLFSTKFAGLDSRGIPTFYDDSGEEVYYYDLQDRENLKSILKYEGSAEPRGAGGFTNTFNYKNFSLSVFLSYKFDYKIRLDDAFSPRYTDFSSFSKSFVNRWVVPGDENITDVPVILDKNVVEGGNSDYRSAYDLYNKSTARVADGTYVRLKSVRLGYTLPKRWISRIGANNAQLSIDAQNLALLYSDKKLNGQDPEFFQAGGVALPQPRLITTSITIGF
ncbi:SusC/RagA family TonB-linked outer membrane protein [Chryseosolibacter indicus]|uniref:SusC/RagA family TonB-linked outer membrane protein n=1 Tax=Chryseosolibacter indicus TaxID=2782351 RepID=A0ABS5VXP8_9BACT|nr:SusC/RagA family TonB-linked outer membrane protein [Chryseosolibacter indicus]MBT1705689.1 SusC/RagA family TonB-linked outer membrane protein [Chryseosolibacter indicus]